MFIRPADFNQLVVNDPWAALDRSLKVRADRIADVADELIDAIFNTKSMRDDPITRHALLAGFIAKNTWLLHYADEPQSQLRTRTKAALLASKLSDPVAFPSFRNRQTKD